MNTGTELYLFYIFLHHSLWAKIGRTQSRFFFYKQSPSQTYVWGRGLTNVRFLVISDWFRVTISHMTSSSGDPSRCWCIQTGLGSWGLALSSGSLRCSGCARSGSELPPRCLRFPEGGNKTDVKKSCTFQPH